jgi:hypothetical protein
MAKYFQGTARWREKKDEEEDELEKDWQLS